MDSALEDLDPVEVVFPAVLEFHVEGLNLVQEHDPVVQFNPLELGLEDELLLEGLALLPCCEELLVCLLRKVESLVLSAPWYPEHFPPLEQFKLVVEDALFHFESKDLHVSLVQASELVLHLGPDVLVHATGGHTQSVEQYSLGVDLLRLEVVLQIKRSRKLLQQLLLADLDQPELDVFLCGLLLGLLLVEPKTKRNLRQPVVLDHFVEVFVAFQDAHEVFFDFGLVHGVEQPYLIITSSLHFVDGLGVVIKHLFGVANDQGRLPDLVQVVDLLLGFVEEALEIIHLLLGRSSIGMVVLLNSLPFFLDSLLERLLLFVKVLQVLQDLELFLLQSEADGIEEQSSNVCLHLPSHVAYLHFDHQNAVVTEADGLHLDFRNRDAHLGNESVLAVNSFLAQ